jgi:hypothetical protein
MRAVDGAWLFLNRYSEYIKGARYVQAKMLGSFPRQE